MSRRAPLLGFNTACFPGLSVTEALHAGQELGFEAVELLAFDGYAHSRGRLAGFWFDQLSPAQRRRLKASLAAFRSVSLHAPFTDMPTFCRNPGLHRECVRQLRVAIEAAGYLEAVATVVHINHNPNLPLEEAWPTVSDTLASLGELAAAQGTTVAVETGFPNDTVVFRRLIEDVGHQAVGVCLDVGHLVAHLPSALRGSPRGVGRLNEELVAFVEALGAKIYHVHLHDVARADFRDHRQVGTGIIDLARLFSALADVDFQGLMILELEEEDPVAALVSSREVLRPLATDART